MLSRIRKTDEQGFTLIELLVVMIIIGILAAIAIPTFLNQRNNGYNSAMKSDLKNAATAIESYAVDKGGVYTGATAANTNFTQSSGVTVTYSNVSADDYCLTATHTGRPGKSFVYKKTNGVPAEVGTGTPAVTACAA